MTVAAQDFDLLAAVASLVNSRGPDTPDGERVFFRAPLSLASPAGEVADFIQPAARPAELVQTLVGLLGTNASLPYAVTDEFICAGPDAPTVRLLDVFHHILTVNWLRDRVLAHIGGSACSGGGN